MPSARRLPMIPRALAAWGDLRGAMRAELDERPPDGRLLGYLMVALLIVWVSAIPLRLKDAVGDPDASIGMGFVATVFMAPLLFYAIAVLLKWCAPAFGGSAGFYEHRLALFWGLLVATPVQVVANVATNLFGSHGVIMAFQTVLLVYVLGTCVAETNGAKPLWRGVGQVMLLGGGFYALSWLATTLL
jgi:hypothetical protein